MPLFKKTDDELSLLSPIQFDKEKDLQRLIEANLPCVLDMHLLASEFRTSNGRIDTLAIDFEGAPVIIEYKRTQTDSVINQSLSYLRWLTDQQPEFFQMLMQMHLPKDVMENLRLDWRHPRVICIAESFNRFDLDTAAIVPLRIELFKYRLFEGDMLSIESVILPDRQNNLFDHGQQNSLENNYNVILAMKEQTESSHLIQSLFDELQEKIMSLDPLLIEKVGKRTITYRLTKIFAEVLIRKDRLVIDLRPIDLEDPREMVERIAATYTVTLNRRITLTIASDLDYVFGLIEQSYKNVL